MMIAHFAILIIYKSFTDLLSNSKNSLSQMQKQNDLTQKNMLFQLRPWIGKILSLNGSSIDDTSLHEERFMPAIGDSVEGTIDPFRTHYIYIHNYGKMPALSFRMRHEIISDPSRIELDRNNENFGLEISNDNSIPGQIMPGQTVRIGFNHNLISLERYAIFQFEYAYLDHEGHYRVILELEDSAWNYIFEESL